MATAQAKQDLKNRRRLLVEGLSKLAPAERKDYLEKLEKQAETYLQEQLKAALAITQRAVTLAAILGAVIAAIAGLAGTLAARQLDLGVHYYVLTPMLLCLIIALSRIFRATMPDKFYYAGTNPVHWADDVVRGRGLEETRIEQLALYSESITDNTASMKEAQGFLRSGYMWIGLALGAVLCGEFVIALSFIAKHGLPPLP
ncbi:hypothetical protein [Bradyrhizobium genomosp. III]|uniref:hypothetical protein n=1 Tax=Bradyrhizobium genomosp. III TaxID=2683271 RepID=UPI0005762801|nr:hypothetical protein [Bradyrhizobium sp. CCBAU 15635]